jgi:hypothetical protein
MDPTKRLQVLNSSSPSLRLSAGPAQPLRVTTAPAQNLILDPHLTGQNTQVFTRDPNAVAGGPQSQDQNVPQENNTPVDTGLDFLGSAANAVATPFKPFGEGLARLLPGGQNDLAAANETHRVQDQNFAVYRSLYAQGKINKDQYAKYLQSLGQDYADSGKESQRIADTADRSQVLGSAALTAATPFLGAAEVASSLPGRMGLGALEGAAYGGVNDVAAEKDPTIRGAATQAGIGAALGGAFPALGAGLKFVKNKIAPSPETVGLNNDTLNYIQKSSNADDIHTLLSSVYGGTNEALQQISQAIAQSDNKKFIINELARLPEQAVGAAGAAAVASDEVARAKYHNSPLTGESQQTVPYPSTEREVPLGPQAPNDGNPIQLNAQHGDLIPQEQIDEALKQAGVDNQPAFERGYGKKEQGNPDIATTPNPTNQAQEAYQAEQSAQRAANSREATTYQGGLDPHSPLDNIAAFERKGTTLPQDEQNAARLEEIKKQLAVMPSHENTQSVLFNMKKQFAESVQKNPAMEKELRQHYEQNVKTLQSTLASRQALEEEAASIQPRQTPEMPAEAPVVNTAAEDQVAGAADRSQAATQEQLAHEAAAQSGAPVAAAESAANVGDTVAQNADKAAMPARAEDVVPNADDATKQAVQEVLDNLNKAQGEYDAAGKVRSREKAQRLAAGQGAFDQAGGGEAGFQAQLGSLKGKYSESGFEPINASPEAQDQIINHINANSELQPFEKINTINAMRKIWGAAEGKPTTSDINYIRKYFGEDMGNAVEEAIQEDPKSWRDHLASIAGTPRALMATADFSFGGRQGAPLGTRFPKEWAQANVESVKFATDANYFQKTMQDMRDSPYYETIKDAMHVQLPAADKEVEEAYAGADLAEKIPGVGRIVSGSDRAYSGGLSVLRFKTAQKIIDSYGGIEQFHAFFGEKGGDEALKALGEVINTFSGRGGKAGGLVEQHMKTLSTTLFAPRLWAAKLNSINPVWYARLAKSSPEAAKLALQTQGAFLTTAGTVLAIASAAGADVNWDPRSADFAKIRVGNTRYDILGGLQQNIRLAAQMVTGEKINSQTGQIQTLGDGFGKPTRYDILTQAFQNKENPLLALATKFLNGHDAAGNPYNFTSANPFTNEVGKILLPLNAQDIVSTSQDVGSAAKGTAMALPGFAGIGVQTYGNTPSKNQSKDANGNVVWKGKTTPDMVLDANKQPILDAKGKPITAKFPPNATPLEKQAIMDEKRKSALSAKYKRTLSGEDQALMKLSDDKLKEYVKNGSIDQARFDKIKNDQKYAETQSNGVHVPDGANSDAAQNFYKKFNSMDKKDQAAWLKQAPDDNAKAIADHVNKDRMAGLSEFKPSNQLSKLYAEYEKDLNTHPEYTEIDKRNKAKAFQISAAKTGLSANQSDLLNEGGSNDTKALIRDGKIQKADLDAAMQTDAELYKSGLEGSLKFSKTFRKAYGYGLPSAGSGTGSSSSGGSSGGSGSKSYDANGKRVVFSGFRGANGNLSISTQLPPNIAAKGAPVPGFSAVTRANPAQQIKFNGPPAIGGGQSRVQIAPFRTKTITRLRNSVAR